MQTAETYIDDIAEKAISKRGRPRKVDTPILTEATTDSSQEMLRKVRDLLSRIESLNYQTMHLRGGLAREAMQIIDNALKGE